MSILGWNPDEMIGKPFASFICEEDLPAFDELEAASVRDRVLTCHSRVRFLRKDGSIVWISTNARLVWEPDAERPRESVLIMRDVTERKVLEDKLSALAMTDALTGLWNRRAFDQALTREWKRTIREGTYISLLLLDLDQFKPLNDRYGHTVGDECLTTIAAAISDTVRASDMACRWGGDEVAIILPCTDEAGAMKAAEKVRAAIEAARFRCGLEPEVWASVTTSIGVACASSHADRKGITPSELVAAADRALYAAKHGGKNRVMAVTITK
jgi:diguanylate cyclase (GGDEF)-like protein/PAS domain S-box-containing protein